MSPKDKGRAVKAAGLFLLLVPLTACDVPEPDHAERAAWEAEHNKAKEEAAPRPSPSHARTGG